MSEIVAGIVLSTAGIILSLLSAVPAVFSIEPVLASITVWEILDILANILAPLIGALIAIIVWLHRRITRLEEAQTQHEASLYGLNNDQLASGVTKEIQKLKEYFNELEERFDERIDELEED